MRLDINLASQPYEDARQFWLRWGTALVVASILTLMLMVSTITGWYNARRDHRQIAELRAQIAQRDQKRREAEEFLSRPENRTTRDQSQFINQLIERKSFSWTRVLEDLEKVMPTRVHLVSIHPELDDDNQLAIKIVVAGDSPDRAIELARRMEESRRFTRTYIDQESSRVSTTGDTVQLNIDAIYVPETNYVPTPAPKSEIPKRRKP
jgi:type IV pilus assembly protein PilN